MKLQAIQNAIVLTGFAGVAAAGDSDAVLQTAIVSGSAVTECPPPNDTSSLGCDALNQLVRANFTTREIGILFGTRTSGSWYLRDQFESLRKRYLALVQEYVARQDAAQQPIAGK